MKLITNPAGHVEVIRVTWTEIRTRILSNLARAGRVCVADVQIELDADGGFQLASTGQDLNLCVNGETHGHKRKTDWKA